MMLYHSGCMDGFIGRNCNVQCPLPSYGQGCQLECKCQPSDCHHVFGCRRSESGKRKRTIQLIKNIHRFKYIIIKSRGMITHFKIMKSITIHIIYRL